MNQSDIWECQPYTKVNFLSVSDLTSVSLADLAKSWTVSAVLGGMAGWCSLNPGVESA